MVRAAVREQRKELSKNSLRSISLKPTSSGVFVVVLLQDKRGKEHVAVKGLDESGVIKRWFFASIHFEFLKFVNFEHLWCPKAKLLNTASM